MAKDKANIFKLNDDEQAKYDKNPFFDCKPGALDYAQGFLGNILHIETPYILLLEDNFGMGKTHFITRFVKFLGQNNVNAMYFSAWENDYISDPFLAFSKEIISFIKRKYIGKRICSKGKEVFDKIEGAAEAISFNLPFCTIDCKTIIERFKKEDEDPVKELRKTLSEFIKTLPNEKLVLIVDELDRCRPDYAMKTLEVIKHFFDAEGLFVIVPSNTVSLNNCVEALYGISHDDPNNNNKIEWYLNKFFDNREPLYKPDYKKIVDDFDFETKLKTTLDSGKLLSDGDKYNSLNTLKNKLAHYAESMQLTIRNVTNACRMVRYYCQHIKKKLDCEYLAYIICKKVNSGNNEVNCQLDMEHPFCGNGMKKALLKFSLPREVFNINNSIQEQPFTSEYPIFNHHSFNSYEEIDIHFLTIKNGFKNNVEELRQKQNVGIVITRNYTEIFNNIRPKIDEMIEMVSSYREKWDSDDNDEELKKYYDLIVNESQNLHILD